MSTSTTLILILIAVLYAIGLLVRERTWTINNENDHTCWTCGRVIWDPSTCDHTDKSHSNGGIFDINPRFKGGVNPPNQSTKRPSPPQGSGGYNQ